MIYGRLTPTEVAERGDNPFIEANGRIYRITERHKTMVGVLNYQAEECDPREYERWKALREEVEQARQAAEELASAVQQVGDRKEDDEGTAGVREPRRPQPQGPDDLAAVASRPYDAETGWYKGVPVPQPSIPAHRESSLELRQWAKENGWIGRGPVPKSIRRRYYEQVNRESSSE